MSSSQKDIFYDVMWAVMLFKLNVQSSDSLRRLLILEYAAPCHFLNAGSKIWDENESDGRQVGIKLLPLRLRGRKILLAE